MACSLPAPLVRTTTATALAGVCETYFDPDDPDRWASIHSNPPGPISEYTGLSIHPFGKGRCIVSQLRLVHNLGKDPVADKIFYNLMEFAANR